MTGWAVMALTGAMLLPTGSVAAQLACAPRAEVAAKLLELYGERPAVRGFNQQSQLMFETFANAKTGTWTLMAVAANRVACFVASGQMFETLAAAKPGAPL